MSFMRPFAIAALSAVVATPALAEQEVAQKIYINPSVGFQLFDDQRDLSETATFNIGGEYRFLQRWAVEAVYSRANADRKYVVGESEFKEYRVDGLYYFADPGETWNPYLAAGAGHADFGGTATYDTAGTDHKETRVNVGAGVRYNITDSLSLRGDLREFHGIDESTFDTVASLGISFGFGRAAAAPMQQEPQDSDKDGVNDTRDQCPDTPFTASVDANGCELDSDNDGVPNTTDRCPNTPTGAQVDGQGCERDSDNDGVANDIDQCPDTTAGATVDNVGCEGIVENVRTIELSVKFPNNSSIIGDTYDDEIRQVADFMKANPGTTVEIAGHTDSAGTASYNEFLSLRRAQSVAARLVNALGIDDGRVTAVGYGESEPVASNDTPEGRAQNRRVEARVQIQR
ncbi:OmpA family protein [Marinobacter caseinilyticus]|uniref:OmpA family protein n=1 Tax=Marinobacter caseinilyticus TaxID=2692195 RepID=UPI00140D8EF3|nr:OmpA family protein [Marinobacter caseinilyticus]